MKCYNSFLNTPWGTETFSLVSQMVKFIKETQHSLRSGFWCGGTCRFVLALQVITVTSSAHYCICYSAFYINIFYLKQVSIQTKGMMCSVHLELKQSFIVCMKTLLINQSCESSKIPTIWSFNEDLSAVSYFWNLYTYLQLLCTSYFYFISVTNVELLLHLSDNFSN